MNDDPATRWLREHSIEDLRDALLGALDADATVQAEYAPRSKRSADDAILDAWLHCERERAARLVELSTAHISR